MKNKEEPRAAPSKSLYWILLGLVGFVFAGLVIAAWNVGSILGDSQRKQLIKKRAIKLLRISQQQEKIKQQRLEQEKRLAQQKELEELEELLAVKLTHKFVGRVIQVIDESLVLLSVRDLQYRGKIHTIALKLNAFNLADDDLLYVGAGQLGFYQYETLNRLVKKVRLYEVKQIYTGDLFYTRIDNIEINFCPLDSRIYERLSPKRAGYYRWEH